MNKAIIIGNVCQDPEVRYTQNGSAVANFSVATSERWKDKDGQQQEETEFHRIIMWGKLAEISGEYVTKGMKLLVEGKIVTRKWQNKDGVDMYTTEIVGKSIEMLSKKRQDQDQHHQDQKAGYGAGTGEEVPF